MIIKLKNLINYLLFLLISPFIKNNKIAPVPGTMLVIRLDAIGDYVLFRNFLKSIKESQQYKNYKITLCGNIVWKDLAESLDAAFIDDFIWIERKRFYGNLFYKFSILKNINERGFEIVVNSTYTREILYGDEMVWVSNAGEKIGSQGALDKHAKWKRNLFSDKYYTRLIEASSENLFEFNRNKEFFENFLQRKINLTRPSINTMELRVLTELPENYAVIFPGAKEGKRRWSYLNYITVANHLIKNQHVKIVLPGFGSDKEIAEKIYRSLCESKLDKSFIIDITGKTSLTELIKIIDGARILISNETGAVHIAAAVETPFICISNGNHLGRFHPYPKDIFDKAYYVYPEEIMKNISSEKFMKEAYRFSSDISIDDTKPQRVIELINKLLTDN